MARRKRAASRTNQPTPPSNEPRPYYKLIDHARNWAEVQDLLSGPKSEYGRQWAFRGMSSENWDLLTSLERMNLVPDPQLVGVAERCLLSSFRRRAHHYLDDLPDSNDTLEWLALMQHHGAPTRLLDWTRSPYVAMFFAFEGAQESSERISLWAIDWQWCKMEARRIVEQQICRNLNPQESLASAAVFNHVFMEATVRFVAPLQPFRMNERLTIQQGMFICPGSPADSFVENFKALGGMTSTHVLHKIVVPSHIRTEVLEALGQMNISRATLFPGLDGFAQSLRVSVEVATSRGSISSEMFNLAAWEEWGF